jgi:hypothetical protein
VGWETALVTAVTGTQIEISVKQAIVEMEASRRAAVQRRVKLGAFADFDEWRRRADPGNIIGHLQEKRARTELRFKIFFDIYIGRA